MKITYITGATSTGKTTLAKNLYRKSTILSLDALSKSLRLVFDDFKLYTDEVSIRPSINNEKFLFFVQEYIKCFIKDYPNTNLVVEGCHFTPSEFLSVFPNAKVIALGITDETIAMMQINKRDWMSKLNETIKKEYVSQIVAYSLELKKYQGKYRYLDFAKTDEFK